MDNIRASTSPMDTVGVRRCRIGIPWTSVKGLTNRLKFCSLAKTSERDRNSQSVQESD